VSAGGSLLAAEMTQVQRMARSMPPRANSGAVAAGAREEAAENAIVVERDKLHEKTNTIE